MVFSAPLRIVLLGLLHFSTCAVGEDVDPPTLMNIVKTFQKKLGKMGQYTVAFRVEKSKCLPGSSDFPDQDLLTQVEEALQKNEVYQSNDLIAAKADKDLKQHSEYRLKNSLKKIVDVKDKCVVYFTANSPCLSKCLSDGNYNIKASLTQLEGYEGIKALAFQDIFKWKDGGDKREDVIIKLKEIAPDLPYYQCNNNQCEAL